MPENEEIPDNSLVMGAPGHVIRAARRGRGRPPDPDGCQFVENRRRFARGLKPIAAGAARVAV